MSIKPETSGKQRASRPNDFLPFTCADVEDQDDNMNAVTLKTRTPSSSSRVGTCQDKFEALSKCYSVGFMRVYAPIRGAKAENL